MSLRSVGTDRRRDVAFGTRVDCSMRQAGAAGGEVDVIVVRKSVLILLGRRDIGEWPTGISPASTGGKVEYGTFPGWTHLKSVGAGVDPDDWLPRENWVGRSSSLTML